MSEEFEVSLPLSIRNEQSRVLGDYYRDLANNYWLYAHKEQPVAWPDKPKF